MTLAQRQQTSLAIRFGAVSQWGDGYRVLIMYECWKLLEAINERGGFRVLATPA